VDGPVLNHGVDGFHSRLFPNEQLQAGQSMADEISQQCPSTTNNLKLSVKKKKQKKKRNSTFIEMKPIMDSSIKERLGMLENHCLEVNP
jgi:hypothetical protein